MKFVDLRTAFGATPRVKNANIILKRTPIIVGAINVMHKKVLTLDDNIEQFWL